MKKTTITSTAVIAAFVIIGGTFSIAAPAVAISHETMSASTATSGMSMNMGGGDMMSNMMSMMRQFMANHKFGMISSIQNDEQGQPAWIVSGHWMMEMASQNDTTTSSTTGGIINIAGFDATLHMVRLNGSAMHTHEISNFTQTGDATFDSSTNSTTITGTATITMREGPVQGVPMTIQIAQDKVIAISPDPTMLENHFGDTPIYGIVVSPEMIEEMMMMRHGNMTGMMMQEPFGGMMRGNMTGMMQGPTEGMMRGNMTGMMQGPTEGMMQGPTEGMMQGPTEGR